MEALNKMLEFELLSVGEYKIKVYTLGIILLILLITNVLLFAIKKVLFYKSKKKKIDLGNIFALFQIIKYVIWIIASGFLLNAIGLKVTVLVAGSAALLVGVGLGLQQTFNDVLSGIILLSGRSIKIDDILEIDGDVVKIQNIGLRTSKGLNTDDISVIIPNSLITTNKVINWSHQSKRTRFKIDVGVSYTSDVDLVIKVLQESVLEHSDDSDKKFIEARLVNFGSSSLDFQVLFFSQNIFRINKLKSDIRRTIHKNFIENNISIPFPQMDVHLKSGTAGISKDK